MAIETDGTVLMNGESGPALQVVVRADEGRLQLVAGEDLVGDWSIDEIGVNALHDGFVIRAEGEVFTLRATEDASLAEELGVVAAPPRMARKLATLHTPDEPEPVVDVVAEPKSNILAIAFALGGVLVALGAILLRAAPTSAATRGLDGQDGGAEFWIGFAIGGGLMVLVSLVLWIQSRWVRAVSLVLMAAIVVLFGLVINEASTDASFLTAYGFIAGGLVVGVAVLFSGSVSDAD